MQPRALPTAQTDLKCEHISVKIKYVQTNPRSLKKEAHEFIHMSHFYYFPLVNSQVIDCGSII